MNDRNPSEYFLYVGKSKSKIPSGKSPEQIRKVYIGDYLFLFYPKAIRDSDYSVSPDFHLQFFDWAISRKVADYLSQKNWTIHINVDDMDLKDEIDYVLDKEPSSYESVLEKVGNLIISRYSIWPNKIIAEPATYVILDFKPPYEYEYIEVKYGETILLSDSFFKGKNENEYLKEFLKAYCEIIKEDLIL